MALDSVDDILDLFARRGGEHYGEAVSQTDHARQCAALAASQGLSDSLVAAALLHDIGHLIDLDGDLSYEDSLAIDQRHDSIGADALRGLFGPAVTEPIALHVTAKRWRCTVQPDAVGQLSPASRTSLELQGGTLTDEEQLAFEGADHFEDAVVLRSLDDAGKVEGLEIPELASYEPLLRRLVVVSG